MFVGQFQEKDTGTLVDVFLSMDKTIVMFAGDKELKMRFDEGRNNLIEQIEDNLKNLLDI